MKQRPNKSKVGRKPERKSKTGRNSQAEPKIPLSPRLKWLFRFIAIVIVPLLLLGTLEIALRLSGYGYSTDFFEKLHAGEHEFLVDSGNFSLRFFPTQLVRRSEPVKMK